MRRSLIQVKDRRQRYVRMLVSCGLDGIFKAEVSRRFLFEGFTGHSQPNPKTAKEAIVSRRPGIACPMSCTEEILAGT